MKKVIFLLFAIAIINCARAQTSLPQHDWHVTLKIVDESGQPIAGASAGVGFYWVTPPPDRKYTAGGIDGVTDTNGVFKASHASEFCTLHFVVQKAGYYTTGSQYSAGSEYDPLKWNPTLTLTLRKVGQPVAMYAKRVETKIQKENEPVGFDLTAGDWVSPFGTGKNADLFFTVNRKIVSTSEYEADLKLTFPNRGDGIVVAPAEPEIGSAFKTARVAADSGYQPEHSWHYSNSGGPESVFGYFIRVRTQLDENGNVKSALYGKIRGDFRFYAGTKAPRAGMGFDYYLNPVPNSRNMEFDPKQNLFGNLPSLEEISEP